MPAIIVSKGWPTVRLREVDIRVTSSGNWFSVNAVQQKWDRYTAKKTAEYTRKYKGRRIYYPTAEERREYLGSLDPSIEGTGAPGPSRWARNSRGGLGRASSS